MFTAEEIVRLNNNWIALVFIVILLVLVVVNFFFGKRLYRTNRMLLTKSYVQTYLNKDKGKFFAVFSSLLFAVQILTISLLFYLIFTHFSIKKEVSSLNLYLFILGIIAVYFILRYLIGFFLANLFQLKELFLKLSFEKSNYLSNIILWILPLLLLSSYAKYFQLTMIKITLVFFVIMLIFRYVLLLVNNKKVILNNLFYFILYICTLEIAPLILILKLTI
ncbi:DUF4271 domain-containing protein [Lutibacter sp.]|uniref:DUF4271 domain-containing protein n=1 Tax=Lutibacter sp. TaxID=1925666 RepID=UPI0039AE95FD